MRLVPLRSWCQRWRREVSRSRQGGQDAVCSQPLHTKASPVCVGSELLKRSRLDGGILTMKAPVSSLTVSLKHPCAALGVLLGLVTVSKLTILPINATQPGPATRSPMSVSLYVVRGCHGCNVGWRAAWISEEVKPSAVSVV